MKKNKTPEKVNYMGEHIHCGEGVLRKWRRPKLNLESIGLAAGMVFMDIGCGDGFFTLPAARIVGETGKVYAVDVDAAAIERLKRKASQEGLKNIYAVVGAAEDTVFCNECADIIFYSTVLHDFKDPAKVLRNAKQMLKHGGKLVNVDWKKKPTVFGPPVWIRFNEEQAASLIEAAGFKIESIRDIGRNHYVITAQA
ncbi:MAG: class I SAM-dependent methyltransferase [Candidatus Bathyarchaeota archaeon]|nr:class I SAM-dependent methyltransferase [Candidatus Bathyarchaeota archaeon]